MDKIVGVIGGIPQAKARNDDDFSDRLSYRYTAGLMILFSILVSTKQYVGDPIQCWVPAHFTGNHEEYTNNYCWIRNTYYLPYEEYVPKEHEANKRMMIPYYQWVPIFLLIEALLFYLPIVLWRTLNNRSGIDVNNIIEAGETFTNTEMSENREKTLRYMTKQMDRYLSAQREISTGCTISLKHCLSRTCCIMCGRRKGNYLISLYLFVKVIMFVNAVCQLFLLNALLGQEFHVYGFEVIQSIINGTDWTASPRFPRVTMCDLKVRRLGNIQRYTVQCVLPINLFNEKIFLFLWIWMVFVAVVTAIGLLTWILRAAFSVDRHRYIKKHLQLMDKLERDTDKKMAVKFVEEYLRQDGVFVMRLVGHNTNALTVTEFVCQLWDNFRNKPLTERVDGDASEV